MSDMLINSAVLNQGATQTAPAAEQKPKEETAPMPADNVAIGTKPEEKETPFIAKLGKGFMKIRENKVSRFLMDTAIGAAGGAAIIALALSPGALAVAGAVVGGVVAGGIGAAIGGFGGWLVGGMSGGPDKASKWGKRGALIGAAVFGIPSAIGGAAGMAINGAIITKLAAYVGGGPAGGAIVGAGLGAAESLWNMAKEGSKETGGKI